MMKTTTISLLLLSSLVLSSCGTARRAGQIENSRSFVCIDKTDPHYFSLSNGEPYIAIGCNIAAVSDSLMLEHYMKELSRNGANFARVWLNSEFFEIETEYGNWNWTNVAHIDRLLQLADSYGIKVKMCIESFRKILPGANKWDTKASYHISNHGPFVDMQQYISSQEGRDEYLRRLAFLQKRYGDNPAVFGWELWNEMNAVEADDIEEWNRYMLPKVHEMFPRNLVMQSLGSLDRAASLPIYMYINSLATNDVMQVHRYVDLGAELNICGAPIDSLASDAVGVLRSYGIEKPIMLAECGAVKPSHTGPNPIYLADSLGTVLHDFLFAPFFCGAAGCGQLWHWDHYIDNMNVWFQIGRFSKAVEGLNPASERFVPYRNDNERLKIYTLVGKNHIVAWCRDKRSTWQSELVDGLVAETVGGQIIDFSKWVNTDISSVEIYDPWKDVVIRSDASPRVELPDFKRSTVVRISF
ncbi:MAG: cellulase family glycosylhydrolase [Tidjanibacter sp.]|nr:cellulase family glycosylhydrolase [Tidjanibacter sp.]